MKRKNLITSHEKIAVVKRQFLCLICNKKYAHLSLFISQKIPQTTKVPPELGTKYLQHIIANHKKVSYFISSRPIQYNIFSMCVATLFNRKTFLIQLQFPISICSSWMQKYGSIHHPLTPLLLFSSLFIILFATLAHHNHLMNGKTLLLPIYYSGHYKSDSGY